MKRTDIYERGLDTVAIWTNNAPNLLVGELNLAADAADVDLLSMQLYQLAQAEDALETARLSRNNAADALRPLYTRASQIIVRLSFGAARARTFTLLHKGPTSPAFSVLADGLALKSFEHATGEVGEHQYKVVPLNSAGHGAESVVLKVQVAQQAAA